MIFGYTAVVHEVSAVVTTSLFRNMKQLLCIVFFACSGCGFAWAQTVVAIRDSISEHQFTSNDQVYLEDPDNHYTIGQVSTVLYDQFVLNYLYAPHNENTESTYWVRIRIRENSQSKKEWLLEFFDQTTDVIEVYLPDQTGGFKKVVMG